MFHPKVRPPGSGVPVAGIILESNPSTSKVKYTVLFLIIFLNLFKFHFALSFAQKILILDLFFFKKVFHFQKYFLFQMKLLIHFYSLNIF